MRFVFIMLLTCLVSYGQTKIYDAGKYQLFADSLAEGNYFAKVISGKEIVSNFLDEYKKSDNYILKFKFAINGLDNENIPGMDHQINLLTAHGDTFIYSFGELENKEIDDKESLNQPKTKFTIKVDLSRVFEAFENKGFYKTNTGMIINKKEFKGVYIAGNISPLSWSFGSNELLKLNRVGNSGIYSIDIDLNLNNDRVVDNGIIKWHLTKDISSYPEVKSNIAVINALYNLSLEEMIEDIRKDSTFMAGKKWDGVWTRDISYSIILAMAYLNPQISMNSLLKKVNDDGIIIQDTGTGGSWPISTDRIVWVIAAYEVYKITGDKNWLEKIYSITKKTLEIDLKTIVDRRDGLVFGETSFLDWREQTYPVWMEPKDIFQSKSLSTNVLFAKALELLGRMESQLNISDGSYYISLSEKLKNKISNSFYLKNKKYLGEYIYGDYYQVLSDRSETLGNALSILFEVVDNKTASEIVSNLPLLEFGTPSVFPQREGIAPYHNDGIWPFVIGYYGMASNKVQNVDAVSYTLSSIYRAALLFLTNKENMVAATGSSLGTVINSDRQLWSVAANIATAYRILLGMEFWENGIHFKPVIPKEYGARLIIKDFKYRGMNLNISVEGYGTGISEFKINGESTGKFFVPAKLEGNVNVSIIMDNKTSNSPINIVENKYMPMEPRNTEAKSTNIFVNGEERNKSKQDLVYSEIQSYVMKNGTASLLGKPVVYAKDFHEVELKEDGENFVELKIAKNEKYKIDFTVDSKGLYKLVLEYANGNGPINTDNNVGIRSVYVDGNYNGIFVFPQRGINKWDDWGESNSLFVELEKGNHKLDIIYEQFNKNMDGKINGARIRKLKVIRIK